MPAPLSTTNEATPSKGGWAFFGGIKEAAELTTFQAIQLVDWSLATWSLSGLMSQIEPESLSGGTEGQGKGHQRESADQRHGQHNYRSTRVEVSRQRAIVPKHGRQEGPLR